MPLLRYFLFAGGALLALLFVANAALPSLPAAERTGAAADFAPIRIHTDRRWPDRVVFDTSIPAPAPLAVATAEALKTAVKAPAPAATADISPNDISPKMRVREAFAQFSPPGDPVKPALKARPKRKIAARNAKRPAGPPPMMFAQQRQFGLFNSTW
jgi:hypothetical protein